jgi:hypothetical protein
MGKVVENPAAMGVDGCVMTDAVQLMYPERTTAGTPVRWSEENAPKFWIV